MFLINKSCFSMFFSKFWHFFMHFFWKSCVGPLVILMTLIGLCINMYLVSYEAILRNFSFISELLKDYYPKFGEKMWKSCICSINQMTQDIKKRQNHKIIILLPSMISSLLRNFNLLKIKGKKNIKSIFYFNLFFCFGRCFSKMPFCEYLSLKIFRNIAKVMI